MTSDIFELLTELLTIQNSHKGRYTGKVINNKIDGVFDGRCKIEVYGVFDGIKESDLPPASPEIDMNSAFMCPEIGSLVTVYFENDDIYKPVYTTKVASHTSLHKNVSDTHAVLFDFVMKGKEDLIEYDKITGEFKYTDRAGTITSFIPKDSYTEITITTTQGIVLTFNKEKASLKNKAVSVVMTDKTLTAKTSGTTVNMTATDIEMESGASKVSMTPATMDLELGASKVSMTPATLDLKLGTSSVAMTPATLNLLSGGSSVAMTPMSLLLQSGGAGYMISAGVVKGVKGVAIPDPSGGGFCAIPVCPILGPHVGNIINGVLG